MLNRAILMGRLVTEPDFRETQSGTPMVRFTLAVDRDYSQGDERQTDFLDIQAWRKTAEFVSKYFHKGQLVAVQGSIQVSNYTDRDGNKRRSWNVVADQVYFAGSKRDDGNSEPKANADVNVEVADAPPAGDFTPVANDDLPF